MVIDAKISGLSLPKGDWIENYFNFIGNRMIKFLKTMTNKEIYKEYKSIFIINSMNFSLTVSLNFNIDSNCKNNFLKSAQIQKKSWL